MNKENCALKLVDEIMHGRKKHQMKQIHLLLSFNGQIASTVECYCYKKTSAATMRSLSIAVLNMSLLTV